MRVFFDTEFMEDGRTIELLSIGLIREDGHYLYAELAEADHSHANDWVKANVLPQLQGGIHVWKRAELAEALIEFVSPRHLLGPKPEFWGYYADYDWVALCQLYGTMMDLPDGWPMYCRDLKQWCDQLGNPRLPEQAEGEHHALADARWNLQVYGFLAALQADIDYPVG
jgi:3' exoribonuclease, RNase T-like